MLAFAMMAAIQHQANKPTPKKTKSSATPKTSDLIPWSIQEIRRIAQRLARKRIQPADVIAMVALAARSSGRSTEISSQHKNHNCNARSRGTNLLTQESRIDSRLLFCGGQP